MVPTFANICHNLATLRSALSNLANIGPKFARRLSNFANKSLPLTLYPQPKLGLRMGVRGGEAGGDQCAEDDFDSFEEEDVDSRRTRRRRSCTPSPMPDALLQSYPHEEPAASAAVGAPAAKEGIVLGGGGTSTLTAAGEFNVATRYAFPVDYNDCFETSLEAYQDIAPALAFLAHRLGKAPADLCIYDPYYCAGATRRPTPSCRSSGPTRTPSTARRRCGPSSAPAPTSRRRCARRGATSRTTETRASTPTSAAGARPTTTAPRLRRNFSR